MNWSEWQALTMEQKDQEIRERLNLEPGSLVSGEEHDFYIAMYVQDDPPQKNGGKKTRRRRRQNKKKTRKSKTKRGKKSRKNKTRRK